MKQWMCLILFITSVLSASAQQSFVENEAEYRNVAPFRKIRVGDGIELIITQSEKVSVAATASRPEYLRRLKTEVVDDMLKLYYDRESLSDWTASGKKLKVYVSVARLEQLTAVAGAVVRVEGELKASDLQLAVRSGASFRGNVQVSKAVVEAESGARMQLSGEAGNLFVNASSGGRVEAFDLAAGRADVKVASGAVVQTTAGEDLVLYASSGGSIRYKGNAKIAGLHIKSGGTVRKYNE
ncbi:MAG: head GIN domain-containing protein [Lacibacter sp.]